MFEKGNSIIEKSYNSERINNEFDINMFALSKGISNKNLKRLDNDVSKGIFINKAITVSEGMVLGILGIGLPDIPVFIGVILKTIYEIALKYGFEYGSDKERLFILGIISTAISKGDEKLKHSDYTDNIGDISSDEIIYEKDINLAVKETSKIVCECIMGAKFIQGIFIIGAISSISNFIIISDISKTAAVKYKKRFIKSLHIKKLL